MRTFREKRPILMSIIVSVIMYVLPMAVSRFWIPEDYASAFLYELVFIAVPFIMVLLFGDLKIYTTGSVFKTIGAGAFMVVTETLLFLSVLALAVITPETEWLDKLGIIYGAFSLFCIGFREESVYRGIIVNEIGKKYIKSRKGVLFTALVSGVIFGLIHMGNMFYGVNFSSAVIQSLAAAGIGFYLAAVYLRGGNLWVLIIVHAVTDAASLFESSFTMGATDVAIINELTVMNLSPMVLFGAIGLFLLRKRKCDEIVERFTA